MQKFEKPKELLSQAELKADKKVSVKNKVEGSQKLVKEVKKEDNLSIQNESAIINLLNENNTKPVKQNWIKNFLGKIFNIF
jgi:hypothetical protein